MPHHPPRARKGAELTVRQHVPLVEQKLDGLVEGSVKTKLPHVPRHVILSRVAAARVGKESVTENGRVPISRGR